MFRVMIERHANKPFPFVIEDAFEWCNKNLEPSKWQKSSDTRNVAFQYRAPVNIRCEPVNWFRYTGKTYVCFAFERKADAAWFKLTWL